MLRLTYLGDSVGYDVSFDRSEHIVTLRSDDLPVRTTGFILSRIGKEDRFDYSDFTTLYRQMDGCIQYSNDGSVYVEPTKDVTVSVVWNDVDDAKGIRPIYVEATVKNNGMILETIKLSDENGWSKTYQGLKMDDDITVEAPDVKGYDKTVSGAVVTYATDVPQPEPITIDDLAEAITEVYEMVSQNASDITDAQEAIVEIYEMITE